MCNNGRFWRGEVRKLNLLKDVIILHILTENKGNWKEWDGISIKMMSLNYQNKMKECPK